MTDLPFDYPSPATLTGAAGKRCRRHAWQAGVVSPSGMWWLDTPAMGSGWTHQSRCSLCGAIRDESRVRQGRSSLRAGKDAERAVAKAYGGKRTGQYGGPDDVVVGELFVVQSKAGRTWFSKKIVDELDKLPRTGGRIPTLVVSDRPGPGRRTRRYVVRLIEDDVALHGERP